MDVPKLNDEPNPGIKLVCDELPYIPNPSQLIELEDPVKLTTFVVPFKNDYFVYWGSVRTNACKHILLWILCRQPYAVSEKQLEVFRSLFTSGHQPIMNNCRHVHSQGYEVFHINPSSYKDDVLFRRTENNLCKKVITIERLIEMKKRRRSRSARHLIRNRNSSMLSLDQERGTKNKEELMKNKGKISCISLSSNDSIDQQRLMREPSKKSDEAAFKIFNKPRRQSYYSKFFSERNKKGKFAHEKPFKLQNTILSEDVTSVKQNKKLMDDDDDDDDEEELSKLRQLNSYSTETKRKYKNDCYEQQDDSNLPGMINPTVINNSGRKHFYSPYSEHKSKINELETIEDDRDKLDVIKENFDWENFQKFKKSNGKEVTFSEEFNMNTQEFFSDNVCFNMNNSEPFMDYKTKGISKFHDDMYADRHEESNDIDFCSTNKSSNNNRLVSRNEEKVVQDVGINTLSLNELIMALSLEYDNETKRCSKLINRNSSHSILASSNRGDSDCEDDNLAIGSAEKQKPNAECNEENTSNFPRYIPIKYSHNEEKHVRNRTQSAVSLSTENSSIPSRVSSLEKRTKKLLSEENTFRNSSSSSNQSDTVLTGSNRKSYRKQSFNYWSQENYNDEHTNRPQTPSCKVYKNITPPQSRCSNLIDKPERTPSVHIFKSSSSMLNNESYNFQPSIHPNKTNRENTEVTIKQNKSPKRKSLSRPKSSHKKDKINQNQQSEENTNNCLFSQTISQTTYQCDDDEFKNRSSLLTIPSPYKISKTNTDHPECNVNQLEQNDFETFCYGESTVEDDSQSDLTLTPSIQTRMSHKYEEIQMLKSNELLKPLKSKSKKQCVKKLKSSAKQSKSSERESKFLMCKDSLQLLDNKKTSGGQTTRIPLRKSLLQKNYLNSFSRERPQSVASSRPNICRTSSSRPRTMEGGILMNRNSVTSETRLRSQIPTFKAGSSAYSRTESILKNYDRRTQLTKPAAPAWRY